MNNSCKITVIIPVYGVEKYIKKCLESVMAQTFEDFECLVVDDGSTDRSIEVAKNTVHADDRFVFLYKENGGQGSARNLGLDNASGEYVAFLDSDDYIEPEYLTSLYCKIVEDDADICICNVSIKSDEGKFLKRFVSDVTSYNKAEDCLNLNYFVSNWVCDKLFKISVFDRMRFDPNVRTFEDSHFTFRVMYRKKITQVSGFLYNYINRPGSTTNSLPSSYLDDRMAVIQSQFAFAAELGILSDEYLTRAYLKTFVYHCVVTLSRFSDNYMKDVARLEQVLDKKYFNMRSIISIFALDYKVSVSLVLFKLSPRFFRFLINARNDLERVSVKRLRSNSA